MGYNDMLLYLELNPLGQLSVCSSDVALTSISEAEFEVAGYSWQKRYEWNGIAFQEVVPPPPPQPTLEQLKSAKLTELSSAYTAVLESGYEGNFRAHESNRTEYAQQLQLFNEAIVLGLMQPTDSVTWEGKGGTETGTFSEYRLFMVQYGMWCKTKIDLFYSFTRAINAATTEQELDVINIDLGA